MNHDFIAFLVCPGSVCAELVVLLSLNILYNLLLMLFWVLVFSVMRFFTKKNK